MCLAELEHVEQLFHLRLHVFTFGYGLTVNVGQLATGGHHATPIFLGELQGTVYEVAVDGYELRVVTLLKIFPRKVVVLGFGSVGGEHIAQHVLLSGEVVQILVQPYGPVARG